VKGVLAFRSLSPSKAACDYAWLSPRKAEGQRISLYFVRHSLRPSLELRPCLSQLSQREAMSGLGGMCCKTRLLCTARPDLSIAELVAFSTVPSGGAID
jgi:hypothetical protein